MAKAQKHIGSKIHTDKQDLKQSNCFGQEQKKKKKKKKKN